MYYLILVIAAVLFSSQFLFNQKFEEECGSSFAASLLFSICTSVSGFLVLFAINGFRLNFSCCSLFSAAIYALTNTLYSIASIKSFESVNLSVYSVFAMLGGMLIPSVYGIIFCNEEITIMKILCCIFIAAALFFTIDTKKQSGKKIYYITVFTLNGLVGVLSVIHQSGISAVDSFSFLMLARIFSLLICAPIYFSKYKSAPKLTKKSLIYSAGFAAFCTIGNLFTLISLRHIQASVQYPIITGGVMIISLIISLIRKEKISCKNIISTIIAFISTILIAIPTF